MISCLYSALRVAICFHGVRDGMMHNIYGNSGVIEKYRQILTYRMFQELWNNENPEAFL